MTEIQIQSVGERLCPRARSILLKRLERWSYDSRNRLHLIICYGYSMGIGFTKFRPKICRPLNWDGIKLDDCITFKRDGKEVGTHHRVVRIEDVDGERRYYTKGDNNLEEDDGYRTINDIDGVGLFDWLKSNPLKQGAVDAPTAWTVLKSVTGSKGNCTAMRCR